MSETDPTGGSEALRIAKMKDGYDRPADVISFDIFPAMEQNFRRVLLDHIGAFVAERLEIGKENYLFQHSRDSDQKQIRNMSLHPRMDPSRLNVLAGERSVELLNINLLRVTLLNGIEECLGEILREPVDCSADLAIPLFEVWGEPTLTPPAYLQRRSDHRSDVIDYLTMWAERMVKRLKGKADVLTEFAENQAHELQRLQEEVNCESIRILTNVIRQIRFIVSEKKVEITRRPHLTASESHPWNVVVQDQNVLSEHRCMDLGDGTAERVGLGGDVTLEAEPDTEALNIEAVDPGIAPIRIIRKDIVRGGGAMQAKEL